MKKYIFQIPEIILLITLLFLLIDNSFCFNEVSVFLFIVSIVLVYQLYSNNRIIGLILSIITLLISIYFMLAVISEYCEFPTVNTQAITLLTVGLSISFVALFMAIVMMCKYATQNIKSFTK